jgi:hypothetical protein
MENLLTENKGKRKFYTLSSSFYLSPAKMNKIVAVKKRTGYIIRVVVKVKVHALEILRRLLELHFNQQQYFGK